MEISLWKVRGQGHQFFQLSVVIGQMVMFLIDTRMTYKKQHVGSFHLFDSSHVFSEWHAHEDWLVQWLLNP